MGIMINPVSYNISFLTIQETPSHEWRAVHIQVSPKSNYKPQTNLISTYQNKLAAQVELLRYQVITKLPTTYDPTIPIISFFTNNRGEHLYFLMTPDEKVAMLPPPMSESIDEARISIQRFAREQNMFYAEPRKEEKFLTSPAA